MATPSPTDGEDAPRLNLMDLPGELRNKIWELSIPTDRVLMISMFDYSAKALPPPAIAWVCRESRSVALQHGQPYTFLDPADADDDPSSDDEDEDEGGGDDNDIEDPRPMTTWFSPALDRIFLAVTGYRRFRWPGQSLGALAADARHVLVQTETFFPGAARSLTRSTRRNLVLSGVEEFPNARSIGAVRVGFMVRDRTRARGRGRGAAFVEGDDYRPLEHCKGRDLEPRIRVVSDPTYVRVLERAHARLTGPCTCWFDEVEEAVTDGGEEGEDGEQGADGGQEGAADLDSGGADSDDNEVPDTDDRDSGGTSGTNRLFQTQQKPMDHHLDHGLSGLWSPTASPHALPTELWQLLKLWFQAQHERWSPTTGPDPTDSVTDGDKWTRRRYYAWAAWIGKQAPHVYAAEMKVYSDGTFGASAIPNCVRRRSGGSSSGCGRLRGQGLVHRLYKVH
ncbi:hypothetical protein PG993_012704 [Apiospora rasikravindrae]|uniref:2EXR domain-containing protein n=1 Tax=Apiospora rasikravindrae TaxID=990691 RepID=A0ABR1S3K4_9PEZI